MNPLAYASDSGIDVGSPNPRVSIYVPSEGHVGIPESVFAWAILSSKNT